MRHNDSIVTLLQAWLHLGLILKHIQSHPVTELRLSTVLRCFSSNLTYTLPQVFSSSAVCMSEGQKRTQSRSLIALQALLPFDTLTFTLEQCFQSCCGMTVQ